MQRHCGCDVPLIKVWRTWPPVENGKHDPPPVQNEEQPPSQNHGTHPANLPCQTIFKNATSLRDVAQKARVFGRNLSSVCGDNFRQIVHIATFLYQAVLVLWIQKIPKLRCESGLLTKCDEFIQETISVGFLLQRWTTQWIVYVFLEASLKGISSSNYMYCHLVRQTTTCSLTCVSFVNMAQRA